MKFRTLTVIFATGALPFLQPSPSAAQLVSFMQDSPAYLIHGSPGYLGVTIGDIDNDRAVALKLKDARGAEVVTVDHDAPAGKAGLQPHDVILQVNGQPVEGAEQLRRVLHETPPGRTVSLVVSRDGQQMSLSAQLADRAALDREIWGKHVNQPEPEGEPPASTFFNDRTPGFRGFVDAWPAGSSSFSVGAVVDPLGTQLAGYFGVTEGVGLLVKSVDRKSLAAAAGLKAGDIVLKVNEDTMGSRADWQRILRANEGKQVQVTVLRDKKQQQLTMQAGNSKKKGAVDMPPPFSPEYFSAELCPAYPPTMLADLQDLSASIPIIDADAIRAQANQAIGHIDGNAIREQVEQATKNLDVDDIREQVERATANIDVNAIRAQAEQATRNLQQMKIQLEEMKQQLNQLPE